MPRISYFGIALLALGMASAVSGGAAAGEKSVDVQKTVDRAITYIQTDSAAWLSQRDCAACHHVALPVMALSSAQRHGYTIDAKFLADTVEASLGSREKMISSKLLDGPFAPADTRPMARGVNMGQVFNAAVATSLPSLTDGQKQSVRIITDDIVKKQQADGSWEFFLSRPPVNENQVTDTAWIIMALQQDAGAPKTHHAALDKGLAWLAASKQPENLQMKALKLLLAVRAGKSRDTFQANVDELLAAQHADGGWSQLPSGQSDAFATGQTLYVLALAGCRAERPEIANGINFLVATQKDDGSWPMTSRATPDGRPGSAKLLTPITVSASSWATLGLTELVSKGL